MAARLIALNHRRTREQNRAFVTECPLTEYDTLTRSTELQQLVNRINNTTDDEQQRQLKSALPFRCAHYTRFRDNHRDREHICPESFTWQTCVDIDDPELVERANTMSEKLDIQAGGEWQCMMLHKDYSARRKLHIDIRLPIGMTVPEAQRAYCRALGVEADTSCFTPERFIYITPADYEIYRADGWYEQLSDEEIAIRRKAYTDRGLTIDGRTADGNYFDEELGTNFANLHEFNNRAEEKIIRVNSCNSCQNEFPQEFKGIAYDAIIAEFWRRTGGVPSEGERNKRLHQLAANLRAICDNNQVWLLQVMPSVGLSQQELQSIIHSACKEPTKGSKMMDDIVARLSAPTAEIDIDTNQPETPAAPLNVKALPMGLKESLVGVPPKMHMPVLCSVLPLAAAYADQVEVRYCDGEMQKLGMMAIIHGEQASGKSVCKHAINIWLRQLEAEDELARQREDEWRDKKKARKANEKAPDDPKVLIRVVPITISCSTLLKRLKNSRGHTLFSFGEELDTLRKTNGAGSWSSKYDIYRLAFDPLDSKWGQDYNSDQAESGVVCVAYNWTMLGTDGAVRKCFKNDNIENGLSSRMLLAEMPDSSFAKMPKYRKRTTVDENRIQQAVSRLRSYTGYVDTPKLRHAIEEWCEQKRIEAAKDIDHVKDVYRRRAAVIGFRCGVVFHLLTGNMKESKACTDFAVMMAQYSMEQQIRTFGSILQNQYVDAEQESKRYGCNRSIFDQLPPTFTIDDVIALKAKTVSHNAIVKIVSRWNIDGWVEKIDATHWSKTKHDDDNVTK